jgi:hypothetical protein
MKVAGANPGVRIVRHTVCHDFVNGDAVVEYRVDNMRVLDEAFDEEAFDEEAVVQDTLAEDRVTKLDVLKTCSFMGCSLIARSAWILDQSSP